jgi:hypothetical protein
MGLTIQDIRNALTAARGQCGTRFQSQGGQEHCRSGVRLVETALKSRDANLFVELGIIRSCKKSELKKGELDKKICLIAKKTGRVLGRHRTKKSALRQERKIQIEKRRRA